MKPAILEFKVFVIVISFLCVVVITLYGTFEQLTFTCWVKRNMAGSTLNKGVSGHLSVYMNYSGKKISKTTGMDELYRDAREKLSSDKGKQLRKDRSTMAEGVFGQIKEDYNYVRIRRRGMANVKKEFLIIAMSFNLRKLHTVKQLQNEEPNILA